MFSSCARSFVANWRLATTAISCSHSSGTTTTATATSVTARGLVILQRRSVSGCSWLVGCSYCRTPWLRNRRMSTTTKSITDSPNSGSDASEEAGTTGRPRASVCFKDLQFERILNHVSDRKLLFLLTHRKGNAEEKAVLIMEKMFFDPERIQDTIRSLREVQRLTDGPQSFTSVAVASEDEAVLLRDSGTLSTASDPLVAAAPLPAPLNGIKCSVIHPVSADEVRKLSDAPMHVVYETPDLYRQRIEPYIQKSVEREGKSVPWIDALLSGNSIGQERILYDDTDPETGFVLIPDQKWDQVSTRELYVLAVVRCARLRSVRDLRQRDLPLLKKMAEKIPFVVEQRFGLRSQGSLRLFLHYHPTYYHLHVHAVNCQFQPRSFEADKAHLLADVIQNLELADTFYAHRTIQVCVKESSPLWDLYSKEQ